MELSIAFGVVVVIIVLLFLFARSYSGNLEENLIILRDEIGILKARIDRYSEKNPTRNELQEERLKKMVAVKEEAEQLSDEAGYVINHWYRGWTWSSNSRYHLSKRVAALTFKVRLQSCEPHKRGRLTRRVISDIDKRSHIVPVVISDYLNFNSNIAKLRQKLDTDTEPRPPLGYSSEEVAQKWVVSLEAAKEEGFQLIQEAEYLNKYWYKRWSASRCNLSKRVEKKITDLDKLFADHRRDLIQVRVGSKNLVKFKSQVRADDGKRVVKRNHRVEFFQSDSS